MVALQSTPLYAAWLLSLSALCMSCAKVSSTDPASTHSDGGGALDLAAPGDLATARDAAAPRRDASVAQDLSSLPDLTQVDLGPFPPGAVYQISVKASGQLMSVHASATANGSVLEQQPAHATPDQRWLMNATATAGVYQIVNGQSQTCVDVNGGSTADNATVWIWSCSIGTSQLWSLKDAGGGFYNIVNQNSMSCLDVAGGGSNPGTAIIQYHCNGGDNQRWLFTRVQ